MSKIGRYVLALGLVVALCACRRQSTIDAEALRERETRIINDWLAENGITNFQRTSSGLVYIPKVSGVGERARLGDSVTVHYTGNVLYGKVFDSSRFRNQPFGVRIGRTQVIAGWTEGLQLMRSGERATLIIPSNLAYGSRSQTNQQTGEIIIPPNAILQFDIEVLNMVRQQ
ncbi:MAG: FKBP-type peptidyl-prolyl cis-trans isomerase [Cytophagales bacterium]|nr:FKBP-type peptidyl-prolyl cis-trans isomerase [Bernardetiaceae bacterium]MDW8204460.1 FKBP-type peptidyl-prolyl cis-trans isomerase [Cytophagales bacterium]